MDTPKKKYSRKCNIYCEYYNQGFLGTCYCGWNSEECPKKGCYKEEAEIKAANGEFDYYFSL